MSAVSIRLNPAATKASNSWNDVCSFAVQPKTLPPKASGATSNPEFPSLRFFILFLTSGRGRSTCLPAITMRGQFGNSCESLILFFSQLDRGSRDVLFEVFDGAGSRDGQHDGRPPQQR